MDLGAIGERLLQARLRLQHRRRTFDFRGFPVDSWLAECTGAPEQHYATFAGLHEELVSSFTPVQSHHVVLEAGCGTGMDAMLLTGRVSRAGRYTGFDVSARNIAWCTATISARFPHFRFHHSTSAARPTTAEAGWPPPRCAFPRTTASSTASSRSRCSPTSWPRRRRTTCASCGAFCDPTDWG